MPSSIHRGWYLDRANGRLEARYDNTAFLRGTAAGVTFPGTAAVTGAFGATGVATFSDEVRIANGKNLRIGTISAFTTTEPTNAVVMRGGTEFAGAITTAGGIMSSSTVLRKIIADGTVSNVG